MFHLLSFSFNIVCYDNKNTPVVNVKDDNTDQGGCSSMAFVVPCGYMKYHF